MDRSIRFPHGRESIYFYWDDIPARRLDLDDEVDRESGTGAGKGGSKGRKKSQLINACELTGSSMRRRLSSVSGFLFKVTSRSPEDLPTRAIVKFHKMAFGIRSDLHTRAME